MPLLNTAIANSPDPLLWLFADVTSNAAGAHLIRAPDGANSTPSLDRAKIVVKAATLGEPTQSGITGCLAQTSVFMPRVLSWQRYGAAGG
jgi:hypothetical protein